MKMVVDTNVLIRYLVRDQENHYQQAVKWFRQATAGSIELEVKSLVVAEAVFVLQSFYKQKRDPIAESFEVLLSQRWLLVENREVLLAAFNWYRQGLHFVDSYLIACAQKDNCEVLTFDQKLSAKLR